MGEFYLSVAVFLLAHIIPPAPPVRTRLISWLGRRFYLIAYSILSIGLLTWVILAGQRAPYVGLWQAAPWQWWVTIVIMPFAIWLVVSGLFETNPLSISLRKKDISQPPGLSAQVTRHPVLWGFLLWAITHLIPNGDVVSLVLFGGTGMLALFGFFIVDRRTRKRLGEAQFDVLVSKTSLVPFAAFLTGRIKPEFSISSALWICVSGIIYVWILFSAHALYLGVDPLVGVGM